MNASEIIKHVTTNPLRIRESTTFEWKGKSPYVRLPIDFVDSPGVVMLGGEKEIQVGPYRLLRVTNDYGFYQTYVRADKLGSVRVAIYKATRVFDLIYRRFIITLAVWKLAEYHPAAIPSWKDIKIFRKKS